MGVRKIQDGIGPRFIYHYHDPMARPHTAGGDRCPGAGGPRPGPGARARGPGPGARDSGPEAWGPGHGPRASPHNLLSVANFSCYLSSAHAFVAQTILDQGRRCYYWCSMGDEAGACWVLCKEEDNAGVSRWYYWNHATNDTVRQLPAGITATWACRPVTCSDPNCMGKRGIAPMCSGFIVRKPCDDPLCGKLCYVKCPPAGSEPSMFFTAENVVWEIPAAVRHASQPSFGGWFERGAPVQITGLQLDERFNGSIGTLEDFDGFLAKVCLPECLGGTMRLSASHIQALSDGTLVQIHSADDSRSGQVGTVIGRHEESFCYRVYMTADIRDESFKVGEVIARSRLWTIDLSEPPQSLQWNGERSCTFVDRLGKSRKFCLHLPPAFSSQQQKQDGSPVTHMAAWPVLIYMHGHGCQTFLKTSKKSLWSEGLQYAAERFVLISPVCEWGWKDHPHDWVLELVGVLRTAQWVDHRRIYLAGYSMGGMSTWELSSRAPRLFAAIAPVAAHHKETLRSRMAYALKAAGTPIYVCHSDADGTCPLEPEQALWNQLGGGTNLNLNINLVHGVDHMNLFKTAFCEGFGLYEMLLKHSLPEYDTLDS